uniref:Hypothetical chloroplast RF66 n=1 Tax=Coleochaete scutata TaxID=3125 RepID=A0A191T5R9_COLSC|nr:hypothetical chloroplast RF66 [Coleochaete scutata]ANI25722.1 hypothetical chloroplast RF66 [Coleochaete scutata]
MIHMELGPSTIVGLGLIIMGILLYVLRTKKPDVSREYDLFFSSIGLLCGGILIYQGWRLDPILLLGQILSSCTAIFFIIESLYLRRLNQFKKHNKYTARWQKFLKYNVDKSIFFRTNENINFYENFSNIPNISNNLKYTKPLDYEEKNYEIF